MIQARAFETWKYREENGISGCPESDWHKAEEQLKQEITNKAKNNRLGQFLFDVNQPLIKLEKNVWEPIDDWLKNAAIIQIFAKLSPILEATGVLLIPIAIWWFTQSNEKIKELQQKEMRAQQEHQQKEMRAQLAVQSYLAQLSDILLQDNLEKNEKLRTIIRASTLALLDSPDLQINHKRLEKDRKGQIIEYLLETKLIIRSAKSKGDKPIISLEGANLGGTNLSRTELSRVELKGANLSEARLKRTNLKGVDLSEAFLRKINLKEANLSKAKLKRANLSDAYLRGVDLKGADLVGANLGKVDLKRADLKRANLREANLEGADLLGANLKGADLFRTRLKGARYTNKNTNKDICNEFQFLLRHPCPTIFPRNFNPKNAGMILVEQEE